VVGEPRQRDGSLSEAESHIRPYIQRLAKEFPGIRIDRMDERFTSKMALQVIALSGKGRMARRDKSLIDKVSAAIILQSYLEHQELQKSTNL
jgi:putative Holliday junction resolvase